jgi:hypothetical protein
LNDARKGISLPPIRRERVHDPARDVDEPVRSKISPQSIRDDPRPAG